MLCFSFNNPLPYKSSLSVCGSHCCFLLSSAVSDLGRRSGSGIFFLSPFFLFLHPQRRHLSLPLPVRHPRPLRTPTKNNFLSTGQIQGYTKICELVLLRNKRAHTHTQKTNKHRGAVSFGMLSTPGIKYNTERQKTPQQQ